MKLKKATKNKEKNKQKFDRKVMEIQIKQECNKNYGNANKKWFGEN